MRLIWVAALLWFGMAMNGQQQQQPPPAQIPIPQQQKPTIPGAVLITQEPHHHLLFEDDDIRVFDVIVPPHQSTLLHEHDYDYIFITFGKSKLTVTKPGMPPEQLKLPDGAVRFAKGGFAHAITNDGNYPFHNMTIEFLNSAITHRGCTCNGGPGDAICDCPNAQPLPANWTKEIGRLFLGGVILPPGAVYDDTSKHDTRLVVPLTPYDVWDTSIHSQNPREIRLPVGRFHWLSPGPHKLQNASSQPLRFIVISF